MLRLTRLVRLVRTLRFEIFYELKMMVLGVLASAASLIVRLEAIAVRLEAIPISNSKTYCFYLPCGVGSSTQVVSGMRVLIWAMVLLLAAWWRVII